MKNTLIALIVAAAASLSACSSTQKCVASSPAVDGKAVAPVSHCSSKKAGKCCKAKGAKAGHCAVTCEKKK